MLRRSSKLLLPILLVAGLIGCHAPTPGVDRPPRRTGLLWVFPGVSGRGSVTHAVRGLRDAGVTAQIEIHDWDRPFGSLVNLVSYDRNLADAQRTANQIAAFSRLHPGEPIDIIGYSGGGGVATLVAEALPDDVRLRHVVLVQPALSPRHDLCAALRHVDGRLVNLHSHHDWFILGWGTQLLGTIDREHTPSAGKDGFDIESAIPDATLRDRFEQHAWTRGMMHAGHFGNHIGIALYEWNRQHVAPYLLRGDNGGESSTDATQAPVGSGR